MVTETRAYVTGRTPRAQFDVGPPPVATHAAAPRVMGYRRRWVFIALTL